MSEQVERPRDSEVQSIIEALAQLRGSIELYSSEEQESFLQTASKLGVQDPQIRVSACPLVVSGIINGRFFCLRERHGHYTVTIAPDHSPTLDVWKEGGGVDIAEGGERAIYSVENDLGAPANALTIAAAAVRSHVGDPLGDTRGGLLPASFFAFALMATVLFSGVDFGPLFWIRDEPQVYGSLAGPIVGFLLVPSFIWFMTWALLPGTARGPETG